MLWLATQTAVAAIPDLARQLTAAAPHADPKVIALASHALSCARHNHVVSAARTLSVIDYSRPSAEPRLWVFDLATHRLLFEEWVAHGRNSDGDDKPMRFSNTPGSLQSSLGVFMTGESYTGEKGYALRLRGLEAGYNDRAYERAIVMHGAWYVDPHLGRMQGRIGRSWGCPSVRPSVVHALIDTIRDGSLLVAYYPDDAWLANSAFAGDCNPDVPQAAR